MQNNCITTVFKTEKDKVYLHPLYLISVEPYELEKGNVCLTPFYIKDSNITLLKSTNDNNDLKLDNNVFNLNFFLYSVYDIKDIDGALKWSYENLEIEEIDSIDRILDCTWECIIKKKDLKNIKVLDNLVQFYQKYFNIKYNINPTYRTIEKTILLIGDQYIDTNLTYNSKKSFQKKIKKYINSNIE